MNILKQNSVVIVEDNPEMSLILQTYIQKQEKFYVSGSYDNCEEAIVNLTKDNPRIVLMDIALPGMTGIEGTEHIKKYFPNTDVIIITVFENSENVFSALSSGASGYLTKALNEKELINALEECLNGGAPMSMRIAKMVVGSFNRNVKSPLSKRETEILTCLSKGKSYKSTANELFISKDTVKFHIKNIYVKLQANSKEEAISIANKEKYI